MSDDNSLPLLAGVGFLGLAAWFWNKNFNKPAQIAEETTSIKDIADAKGLATEDYVKKTVGEALIQKQAEMKLKQDAPISSGLSVVRPDVADVVKAADEVYSQTDAGQSKMVSPFTGQVDTVRNVMRASPGASAAAQNIVKTAAVVNASGGKLSSGAPASATSMTGTGQFGAGTVTANAKAQNAAKAAAQSASISKASSAKGAKK